ncbi:MAG TPA: hypothetical protein VIN59_07735 [Alphaproteobacteria bacterium]
MDDESVKGLTAIFGLAALAAVVVIGGIVAANNAAALKENIALLNDGRAVEIHTSVADCALKHPLEDCQKSFDIATGVAKGLGTSISFNDKAKCEEVHGFCNTNVHRYMIYHKVGKGGFYTHHTRTDYTPNMVGWECDAHNLQLSVPLYNSPNVNVAVRNDGAAFNLS